MCVEDFEERGSVPSLLQRLSDEWDILKSFRSSSSDVLAKGDFVKAWTHRNGRAGIEYTNLMIQTIGDLFVKMDLNRNDLIEEVEWMHYWLLLEQSPSFHALTQINEKLVAFLKADKKVLDRLIKLFMNSSCGGWCDVESKEQDAQLTLSQLKYAARKWLNEMRRLYEENDIAAYLEELLADKHPMEADELFSYYDFMNAMLGRRKEKVQLYQYDLSKGSAKLLSPLLVGKQLDGLWHTSLVVYGKEFWYGGEIFQSNPGSTSFGKPTKIIDLPEQTMRPVENFINFVASQLTAVFNASSYDVLNCNCNHFTDAACKFLLNSHIPEDILTQPDLAMGSWTMPVLRPILNRSLGQCLATGTAKALGPSSPTSIKDNDLSIPDDNNFVIWRHNEGWTRIARLVSRSTAKKTCTLKWIDGRTGAIHTETGVDMCYVEILQDADNFEKNRVTDPTVGGIFGARYHTPRVVVKL
jgi:hypothetical protein